MQAEGIEEKAIFRKLGVEFGFGHTITHRDDSFNTPEYQISDIDFRHQVQLAPSELIQQFMV
jgi:hypothetical protein